MIIATVTIGIVRDGISSRSGNMHHVPCPPVGDSWRGELREPLNSCRVLERQGSQSSPLQRSHVLSSSLFSGETSAASGGSRTRNRAHSDSLQNNPDDNPPPRKTS